MHNLGVKYGMDHVRKTLDNPPILTKEILLDNILPVNYISNLTRTRERCDFDRRGRAVHDVNPIRMRGN